MKSRLPTSQEIEELVSFLPRLDTEAPTPIKKWVGGTKEDGFLTMPWPEYNEVVDEFFQIASKPCWTDYNYHPEEAAKMLETESLIESADLAQARTMLTYCVRGERFSSGHWGTTIERGYIRRLLERLAVLNS